MIKFIFLLLIVIYLVFFIIAFFIADRIIFQPQPSTYQDTGDIIKISSQEGVYISAIFLLNPDAEKTILYNHGNAEDIGIILPILIEIRNFGFSVLAYDYRGYGTSDGSPSEKNSYKDILAAYKYLVDSQNIAPQNIIVLGRSLGGGVATELASRVPIGGLILESTFLSAFRVLTKVPIFPLDKFNNAGKIKNINVPLMVIHGKEDQIIPFWHGEMLYHLANQPKKFYIVENAGHNDLFIKAGKNYGLQLREFLEILEN